MVRLTTSPEALPGSCYKCGSANREFYIDVGTQIEFHGACYLCSECVSEMARLAGYETPENVTKLKNYVDNLEKINYNLLRRVDGLEKAVDGLRASRDAAGDDSVWNNPIHSTLDSEGTSEREADLGTGEGETPESSNDEGMVVVPTDAPKPASNFKLGF